MGIPTGLYYRKANKRKINDTDSPKMIRHVVHAAEYFIIIITAHAKISKITRFRHYESQGRHDTTCKFAPFLRKKRVDHHRPT